MFDHFFKKPNKSKEPPRRLQEEKPLRDRLTAFFRTLSAKAAEAGRKGFAVLKSAVRKTPSVLKSAAHRLLHLRHHAVHIRHRTVTIAHESKARRFPESDRLPVQIVLLAAGLLPCVQANIRERAHLSRRRRVHLLDRLPKLPDFMKKKSAGVTFLCVAVAVVGLVALLSAYSIATQVSYDGKPVDVVGSIITAKLAAATVEDITEDTLGEPFRFEKNSIQYSTNIVPRSELVSRETLTEDLARSAGRVAFGYGLYINDELIGATPYEGTLESLLDQVRQLYVSEDTLSVEFLEEVRIESGYFPAENVMNLGYIAEKLLTSKSGEVNYTVVKGDTWGAIAYNHGMNNNELLALNPGYNKDKLQIGDVLVVSTAVPYLTVRVTERQNYISDVAYDISYIDDATIYQGSYKVVSKGIYGQAEIVADVVYVNGAETERNVLSSVTLSEPVTEVRRRGTKPRPSWVATGQLSWPVTGRISSYFGYRNTGIRGASTNHKGIDITCKYGASICAADGGTVTFSGYNGAMGYVIIINHGNGLCTYYEHNSSLLVSVGAHVYKGQVIAKAGRSGVASGVHCHFGVTKNGVYVNPLKYLS